MPKLNWKLFLEAHGEDRKTIMSLVEQWASIYGVQLVYCGIDQKSIDDYFKDLKFVTLNDLNKIYNHLITLTDKISYIHGTYLLLTKPAYNHLKLHYPRCPIIEETEELKQRLREAWFKRPKKTLSKTLKSAGDELLRLANKDLAYAQRYAERKRLPRIASLRSGLE